MYTHRIILSIKISFTVFSLTKKTLAWSEIDDSVFIDRVKWHAWRKQNANQIQARAIKIMMFCLVCEWQCGVNEQETTLCTIISMECHQWHANVREWTAYCCKRFIFYYLIQFFVADFFFECVLDFEIFISDSKQSKAKKKKQQPDTIRLECVNIIIGWFVMLFSVCLSLCVFVWPYLCEPINFRSLLSSHAHTLAHSKRSIDWFLSLCFPIP